MNNDSLSNFLTQIGARQEGWRQAQELMAPLLAPHFSPFDVYRSREVDVSRHLALLLDPNGSHGQGSLFWDAWVEKVLSTQTSEQMRPINHKDADAVAQRDTGHAVGGAATLQFDSTWLRRGKVQRVEIEHCTTTLQSRRFIDLCIHLQASGGLLAIENKPWHSSVDEPNQLFDYATHLERLACGRPWMLVYVGQGSPSEESIAATEREQLASAGHLVSVTWAQMLDFLTSCVPKIQAQKVRWFVEDFINLMAQETMKNNDSGELAYVAQLFNKNPQMLNNALLLRDSLNHWQITQLQTLERLLNLRCAEEGIFPIWEVNTSNPNFGSYFSLPFQGYDNVFMCLEWVKGFVDTSNFYWGLYIPKLGRDRGINIGSELTKVIPGLPRSEAVETGWPFWVYLHDDPLFTPETTQDGNTSMHPWISIDRADQNFVTLVFERYKEIKSALPLMFESRQGWWTQDT